jgi:hypothetical protein
MGHVGLDAEHWLDPLTRALFVELDDPVHVAVVCDAKCRLTVFYGFGNKLTEARGPIEHGVFGVDMEMCKFLRHVDYTSSTAVNL